MKIFATSFVDPVTQFRSKRLLFLLFLAGLGPAFVSTLSAINASPEAIDLNQPDGTQIRLHIRGDEFSHWFEDTNGFAVVFDKKQYVYATLNAAGGLAPTALRAGIDNPAGSGLRKGLHPDAKARRASRINALPPAQRINASSGVNETVSAPSGISPTGTVKNLVILCKFYNHKSGVNTRSQSDYNVLFNQIGGDATLAPTGSVRDYYAEASYGAMTIQSTVVAWVTLPHTESYYGNGDNGMGDSFPHNAQGMVRDALNLVDPLVNFADFDTDNDGYLDAIDIIHSGYGAETGGGGGYWIWSHMWSLYQVSDYGWTSADANAKGVRVKVYDYHTEPALWGTSGTAIARIGSICHETGHFFGLPDLYDTDDSSAGIGSYCLMANAWGFDNSQLHPPHMSAWAKVTLGWVTPTVITSGTFTAPRVETTPAVFRINNGYPSGEYLLIENRQPYGFESILPQGGLAVWHIDENKADNTDEGYPGQSGWPENNRHYEVALLQADGLYNLEQNENYGDGGDLFRAGGVSSLTDSTVPSTKRYQGGTIAKSGNSISGVSASSASMTFSLNPSSGGSGSGSGGTANANDPRTDFNNDGKPDYVLVNTATRQSTVWYLNNAAFVRGAWAPVIAAGWTLIDTADFNGDGKKDYVLFNSATRRTTIWYLNGTTFQSSAWGPTLSAGYVLNAVADFNGDGKPDYVLVNPATRQTAIWYLNNAVYTGSVWGPALAAGYTLAAVADFDSNGKPDYALFNASTRRSTIWYLNGGAFASSVWAPTIASGYTLAGAADFNGDGKPDYVLTNSATRRTTIWYLNNATFTGSAWAPTLAAGYTLAAP